MRLLRRWGYLLFIALLLGVCVFCFRDLTVPLILLSCWLGAAIYRNLVQRDLKTWLVPCGFAFALFLGCLYYLADFIIFPHSLQAAHRLRNACFMGPLLALAGLFTEIYSPAGKRIAKDHAVNGTAIGRGR